MADPRADRRPPARAHARAACVLAASIVACKTPETHLREADLAVFALVESRREMLVLDPAPLPMESDPASLRQRILRGEVEEPLAVGLAQLLEIAAENSRDFQTQREQLYVAALDLTLERWRFQLQNGGSLAALLEGEGDEATSASGNANAGFSKLFGTGALVVGNVGLDLARSLISSDGWSPTSSMNLSVTQPLLAGFGARIVEEPLTQAERDLAYEARAFERFRRTFAFDVASRAYRLLQLEDAVRNQEANYANLQALSERNAALASAGRLSDIEVGQARQNELRSRNSLLEATSRLQGQRDDLNFFLGIPIDFEIAIDRSEIERLAESREAPVLPDEEVAIATALAGRLDHATVLDRSVDAERKVFVAEDALRAGLALVAGANAVSESGKPAKYNFQDTDWSVGLTYSFPWEKLPQRNAWRESLIRREVALRNVDTSADGIVADLRADARETRTSWLGYEIQLDAAMLAEQRVESARLKLEAGRADTRDVLESEESLLSARNAVTAALVDYTLSRMRYYLDMELMKVDERGIRLEEPSTASPAVRLPESLDASEPVEPTDEVESER